MIYFVLGIENDGVFFVVQQLSGVLCSEANVLVDQVGKDNFVSSVIPDQLGYVGYLPAVMGQLSFTCLVNSLNKLTGLTCKLGCPRF